MASKPNPINAPFKLNPSHLPFAITRLEKS